MAQVETRVATIIVAIAIGLVTSACAPSSKITRTYQDPAVSGLSYQKFLVAAVTQNYETRAAYERAMSARLVSAGIAATPLYQVGGGNQPVDRDAIVAAIQAGGFDAVLYTYTIGSQEKFVKNVGQTAVGANRKSDSVVNLFRYDYEETALPEYESLISSATVMTELYAVSTETKIWEARSDLAERDSVALLIDDAVSLLMGALKRDKLLGIKTSEPTK